MNISRVDSNQRSNNIPNTPSNDNNTTSEQNNTNISTNMNGTMTNNNQNKMNINDNDDVNHININNENNNSSSNTGRILQHGQNKINNNKNKKRITDQNQNNNAKDRTQPRHTMHGPPQMRTNKTRKSLLYMRFIRNNTTTGSIFTNTIESPQRQNNYVYREKVRNNVKKPEL